MVDKTLILKKIIKHLNFKSNKDFAEYLGINPTTLSMWFKRNTFDVELLFKKCDFINADFLLTGKQPMLKENNISKEQDLVYDLAKKGVPYYDVDFTASFLEVENSQQTQPDSYISHPFFRNCDLVVRASGQSMAKLIKHGDAIGLTRVENWFEFIPMGEIYAIVTKNNFRMIKIITKGDTSDKYTLISKPTDSKKNEFPAQQIKKNQILYIYKVQASATLF